MDTATASTQPSSNGSNGHHALGLYGREKPRCEHVDFSKEGEPGYDVAGRCITYLEDCNLPIKNHTFCHAHEHLYLGLSRNDVKDVIEGTAKVMAERSAVRVAA